MNIDNYYMHRGSVREFTQQEVNDSLIRRILTAAMHAPTTGNMQLYSVVVTRDKTRKSELEKCHFCQPASVNAPVLLTFCADWNRFVRWCEISDATAGFDNLQSMMSAFFDATILAQQFCTIAEQQGLGTCYLGTTTYNAPDIARLLSLSDRVIPLLTVALGWPANPVFPSERLPVDAILHSEQYREDSDDDIRCQYSEIDNNPANKKFIDENGKQTLAQVFTDVRYPRSSNEASSNVLAEYLAPKIGKDLIS